MGYSNSKNSDTVNRFWGFAPLLMSAGYNTVEGLYFDVNLSKGKNELNYRKNSYTSLSLRYGIANQNFCPGISSYKDINPISSFGFGYQVGRFINQYNSANPIIGIVNAAYTLMLRENYMKIYQKDVAKVYLDYEPTNGLYIRLNTEYFQREAMVNHSDYSFDDSDKKFTSNNPLNPANDAPAFMQHQGAELGFSIKYLHKQKYESMPGYKNVLGSKYPEFYFNYRTGFGTTGINYQYHFTEIGIGKDLRLNALGTLKFDINAGTFLSSSNQQFVDYKHFNGNQTIFLFNPQKQFNTQINSRERLTGFHALNYYKYSTNESFFEAHVMHNFQGLLLSKLPLIRKLKAREIVGINSLITPQLNYNELYFGLSNIFSFLRLDAGTANNSQTGGLVWFYRVGISININ
jgi:hypothetical protein